MKNIFSRHAALFALMAIMVLPLHAQRKYEGNIRYENIQVSRTGVNNQSDGTVGVNMSIKTNGMRLNSTEMVEVMPMLVSQDGASQLSLGRYLIMGTNRYKSLHRQAKLNKKSEVAQLMANPIVRYSDKKTLAKGFEVNSTFPYKPWMKEAKVVVREQYTGCANCDIAQYTRDLYQANLMPPTPLFKLTVQEPKREEVKRRSESMEAHVNYENAKYDILPNYKSNAAELKRINDFLETMLKEKNITISDLSLAGYASPLGGFAYNQKLSENRTNALITYLRNRFDLSKYTIKNDSKGEDWNGLRDLVENSDLQKRDEILSIIDKYAVDTQREAAIQKLDGGKTYKILLDDFYPQLRRNTITAAYQIRNFTVEEAKEIAKNNPKLLSLNEMFKVAETYSADSPEYMDLMRTAMVVYPNDKVARLNYATCLVKSNQPEQALNELKSLDANDAKVLNVKGCALGMLKRYQEALDCLKQAVAKGEKSAQANLDEVMRVMK